MIALPDEHVFSVADVAGLAGEVGKGCGVAQTMRDGFGEPARRVGAAGENVCDYSAVCLAKDPSIDDGVNVVVPWFEPHHSAVGQDDDGAGAHSGDSLDEGYVVGG